MDFSSFFGGLLFGAGGMAGLGYWLTPPEYRAALLARVHTKAGTLRDKIKARISSIGDDDEPKPPGA